jgi:hypothetical protein
MNGEAFPTKQAMVPISIPSVLYALHCVALFTWQVMGVMDGIFALQRPRSNSRNDSDPPKLAPENVKSWE